MDTQTHKTMRVEDIHPNNEGRLHVWGELPEHVVERILQCLPWECFFRFRIVCKEWKNLLSSAHFSSLWREAAAKQPWLLLCMPNAQMGSCLLFCFFTRTWRTVSLSFLPERSRLNYKGSAAGLLLADMNQVGKRSSFGYSLVRRCVFNPLSRRCFSLPGMISITGVMARGIAPGKDRGSYKVLVVGKCKRNTVVAEVYDSLTKSWKMSSQNLPQSAPIIRNEEMVFCNGFLFCMTVRDGIMGYNVEEGIWATLPMPAAVTNNIWPRLVACGSRLVMAGGMKEEHVLKDVIVWEYCGKDGSDWCWREMGRMPQSLRGEFKSNSCSSWFECVGAGDYVCFRAHGCVEVLVFNLSQHSWEWLPRCPLTDVDGKNSRLRSFALEPRPDLRLS